jgi:hypothetical protein
MKVRELQQQLSKLGPELELLCYSEDEKLVPEGCMFRLFDIASLTTMTGEKTRLNDGTPYLSIGKNSLSVTLAILEVTSEF